MPNITRCGGITGLMKIADLAALENVTVAPHGVGAGIGITAAIAACAVMPNFLIYEYNQLFNPLRHTVMNESIDYSDGVLRPKALASDWVSRLMKRQSHVIAQIEFAGRAPTMTLSR